MLTDNKINFRKHLTKIGIHLALIALPLTLAVSCAQNPTSDNATSIPTPGSYAHGKSVVSQKLSQPNNTRRAKGVILFIGDGMSLTTVTASRIYAGQKLGMSGEEHQLFFESFPHVGLSKTYNIDQQTPDSAGTMTAMITGTKTLAGVLSVGPEVTRASAEY